MNPFPTKMEPQSDSQPHPKRSLEWFTKKWALTVLLLLSPLYIAFAIFADHPGRGVAAWMSAVSIVFVARHLWDLRTRLWFWGLLVLIVAAHVLLICAVPIPPLQRGRAAVVVLLPFLFVQVVYVRGLFWLAERILSAK